MHLTNPFLGSSKKTGRWVSSGTDPFTQRKPKKEVFWPCWYDLHEEIMSWNIMMRQPSLYTDRMQGDYSIGWNWFVMQQVYAWKNIDYGNCHPDWILSLYMKFKKDAWNLYSQFCIVLAQSQFINTAKTNGFTIERYSTPDVRGEIRKFTSNGASASFGSQLAPIEKDRWYYIEARNLAGDTGVHVWDTTNWTKVGVSTFGASQDTTQYGIYRTHGWGPYDGNWWEVLIDMSRIIKPAEQGVVPPKEPGRRY